MLWFGCRALVVGCLLPLAVALSPLYADCLYVLAPLCHLQRTRMSCFSVGPSV